MEENKNNTSLEPLDSMPSSLHSFSLDSFKKYTEALVATNDRAYSTAYALGGRRAKRYSREEVEQIIQAGNIEGQVALSEAFYRISGPYRRMNIYYATLLKYQGILIPNFRGKKPSTNSTNNYYHALDLIDKLDIPSIAPLMAIHALVRGAYYGVISNLDKNQITIIDLPIKYCRSRFKDINNNDIIEFNLSYFDSLSDYYRELALEAYPVEFKKAYNRYKKKKDLSDVWFIVPSSIGICIPMFDSMPLLLPVISNLVNYRDYEDMEKTKDKDEIRKIIVQQIPHLSTGELLFQPDEALEIHRGTVGMMAKNENVSVLTTYADVTVESSTDTSPSAKYNNLDKIMQTIYTNAGVSPGIFSATGNMALTVSIQNDMALMMTFANKLSNIITNLMNRVFGSNQLDFKYSILPVSYYNEKEYIDNAMKEASSGYSLIVPAMAMGISQKQLVNLKTLENNILKLPEILIPPNNSYTTNGNSVGRPALADTEKSDKTIANIEAKENNSGGGSGE